ncbi:hypothetical protein HNR60_004222 [Rhodopseudomonas rhenobacensis]|uniref:Collagen triple helix repeat-containing protein n=1 Tax=Rhodopseudomonas rhenobacensis TaxID=87461 RepID=A0A7W8E0H2_9BRAD|nr:hypothetical protein [Rhodopseudomonas rhenobacensis]MBB5049444.1 hypothetical protein [Rhodopseudomonas rhenobacensis]
MRFPTLIVLIATAAMVAGCNQGSGEVGPKGEPGVAGPPGPAGPPGVSGSSIRTLTSSTCSADGCPVSCDADETLVSAICIGATSAKFSDNLQLSNGIMTARCGSSSTSTIATCARK